MNTINFDLKNIDNFNTFPDSKKKSILLSFNLNRYRFILNEMKKINELVDKNEIIEDRMSKIFKEGCLNFNIINSNYSCNLYIGSLYHLYFKTKDKKYYLYIIKKPESIEEEYKGTFKLDEDLLWKKI